MPQKTWTNYYRGHKLSFSNIALHYPYLYKILYNRPKTILEIGCGPADHSVFIKSLSKKIQISLLDKEKSLLLRNKEIYGKKIKDIYNYDILDESLANKLPKFDLVISQGLMEHFNDSDFLKIIRNFSNITKKMIFSVPSDIYKNKDFGDENLRSKKDIQSLLGNNIPFKFKISNYFDIGLRTKLQLIKQDRLKFLNAVNLLLFKSCHLLVEIDYK